MEKKNTLPSDIEQYADALERMRELQAKLDLLVPNPHFVDQKEREMVNTMIKNAQAKHEETLLKMKRRYTLTSKLANMISIGVTMGAVLITLMTLIPGWSELATLVIAVPVGVFALIQITTQIFIEYNARREVEILSNIIKRASALSAESKQTDAD